MERKSSPRGKRVSNSSPVPHHLLAMAMLCSLFSLCMHAQWQAVIVRLGVLSDDNAVNAVNAVEEIFYQDNYRWTAIMWACIHLTSLERVQLMSTKAKLDSRKRSINIAILCPRLAVRTTLLLCIKHDYVYVRRSERLRNEASATGLDTQRAFAKLNDNVW